MTGAEMEVERVRKVLLGGRIMRGLRVNGPGPTWLLLSPLGMGASAWLPVLRELRGKQAAVAVEFAGFGGSEIGKVDPGYLEQQALLTAYLDTLHGPLVLGACATGAMVCAELARREGHRIDAVFVSGFGAFDDGETWISRVQQASASPDAYVEAMFYAPPADQETLLKQIEPVLTRPAYRSFMDADARAALRVGFKDIEPPTLFIAGRDDRLVTPAEVAAAAGRIDGARVHWVERCGHLVPTERPKEFVQAAQAFLASARQSQS